MAAEWSIIIDDKSTAFDYSGRWLAVDGVRDIYNRTSWSTMSNAKFDFSFEGTSVAFFGYLSADTPHSMTAQIDQGTVFSINGSKLMRGYGQWFQTPKLSDGSHTITVANCTSGELDVDFAMVTRAVGNQTRLPAEGNIIVDNESPSIFYSGQWNRSTSQFNSSRSAYLGYPYGNSTHRSSTPGDVFTFRFTGTSVSVYGIFPGFNLGTLVATYTVDGVPSLPKTYNTTSVDSKDQEVPNFVYYSNDDLSEGNHSLIVNITTATNQTFILDYITYKPWFAKTLSTTVMSIKPSPSSWPSSEPSLVHNSSTPGAVVGGVIGVLALGLFVAILGRWLFLRRKKSKETENISMRNDANDLHIPNPNWKLQPSSQPRPPGGPSQTLNHRRVVRPAEQATDSLPSSNVPPQNIDNLATEFAEPPPYDALSSARPVTQKGDIGLR